MIYELRTYHIYPGKMSAIHKRFSEHTIGLFKKHDMVVVDFWEDMDGDRIHYIMMHQDRESMKRNTEAFRNDPQWLEVKRLSELEGPIVQKMDSYCMTRVPYSPALEDQDPAFPVTD